MEDITFETNLFFISVICIYSIQFIIAMLVMIRIACCDNERGFFVLITPLCFILDAGFAIGFFLKCDWSLAILLGEVNAS